MAETHTLPEPSPIKLPLDEGGFIEGTFTAIVMHPDGEHGEVMVTTHDRRRVRLFVKQDDRGLVNASLRGRAIAD